MIHNTTSTATDPLCVHCGRPVLDPVCGAAGPYHPACVQPGARAGAQSYHCCKCGERIPLIAYIQDGRLFCGLCFDDVQNG